VDIGAVGGEKVPNVGSKPTKTHVPGQVERGRESFEIPSTATVSVDVESERTSHCSGFTQDLKEEPMILRDLEAANRHQISDLPVGLSGQRSEKVRYGRPWDDARLG
jgi:hypothetical protein